MAVSYPKSALFNTSSLRKVGQMKNEIGFRPTCENFLYMILFISNGGGW